MPNTVVHFTDCPGFGGAEQMLLTTLVGLERAGWRCVLLHHQGPGAGQLVEAADRLGVETRVVARAAGRPARADLWRLARAIGAERPALVHAHLIGALRCTAGLLAARLAGVPAVVATQHLYPGGLAGRARLRQRCVSTLVDRYIAVSHAMACRLRRDVVFGSRVTVIHNAIDPDAFAPVDGGTAAAVRARWVGEAARPLVLTLARLNPQKGLEHLIDAATRVPEADFLVAGEGYLRGTLEALVRGRGLDGRFRLIGQRRDVRELLAASDLFVLPSLFEGLPVSVLEAMAAAKPIIATAIEGTDEAVVHEETGLLVPPADGSALATAIRRLLADPGLGTRLAQAGARRVRQLFSIQAAIRRLAQVYDEALGERRARAA